MKPAARTSAKSLEQGATATERAARMSVDVLIKKPPKAFSAYSLNRFSYAFFALFVAANIY